MKNKKKLWGIVEVKGNFERRIGVVETEPNTTSFILDTIAKAIFGQGGVSCSDQPTKRFKKRNSTKKFIDFYPNHYVTYRTYNA